LSHQIPHAKHEERLKPPAQIFTRAARGWKKDPCMQKMYSLPVSGLDLRAPGFQIPKSSSCTPKLLGGNYYHISYPAKIFSCSRLRFLRRLGHYSNNIVPF
jgi:hypothetical protein